MSVQELMDTARTLVAGDKGLLAMDDYERIGDFAAERTVNLRG